MGDIVEAGDRIDTGREGVLFPIQAVLLQGRAGAEAPPEGIAVRGQDLLRPFIKRLEQALLNDAVNGGQHGQLPVSPAFFRGDKA